MDHVIQQFSYLFSDCMEHGLTLEEVHDLCLSHLRNTETKKHFTKENFNKNGSIKITSINPATNPHKRTCLRKCIFGTLIIAVLLLIAAALYGTVVCIIFGVDETAKEIASTPCLLDHNELSFEFTRPLFNCSVCENISTVPVEINISPERFKKLYAFSSVPVLIKHHPGSHYEHSFRNTKKIFTFEFFKEMYESVEGALDMVENDCQFFQYNSKYKTLAEVFNMSLEESQMKLEKWYVGWSNCVPLVQEELHKHYRRPYFIPSDSYSPQLDWIFMGGWGYGAPMHIDNVDRPSWQAQLSGKKTWVLSPVPECEHVCKTLQITVHSGDIIVLDTNQWFHSTYIHPGEISITIGSEYD